MDYLQQIDRALDYIEDHLHDVLDIGAISRHAGMSRWHFQRIFKSLTQETVTTYVRSRRFSLAMQMLQDTDAPVIDVALEAGFETREAFTRAFTRAFGVSPGAFRKGHRAALFLHKARFDAAYIRHLHLSVSTTPEIYEQRELSLAGVATRFYGADSEKSNFARVLPALWDQFIPYLGTIPRLDEALAYGVVRPLHVDSDELFYFAGVEVPASAQLHPALERMQLPAARYAKFAHKGRVTELDRTLNYIYSSWLLSAGVHHTYGYDLELYDHRYRKDSADSLIHYAIPVTEE
ncbi:MAG: AraC family transcriptional regulator [Myxococcales bacterium]|nr:AraC family transcriptional regulator [Myxococcales bacterium]